MLTERPTKVVCGDLEWPRMWLDALGDQDTGRVATVGPFVSLRGPIEVGLVVLWLSGGGRRLLRLSRLALLRSL